MCVCVFVRVSCCCVCMQCMDLCICTHPTVTSNILLPTELETAMSPNPFRATITDVIRSGMDVPAARNVRPMTYGIWIFSSATTTTTRTTEPVKDEHTTRLDISCAYLWRHVKRFADHVRPPDHQVRVRGNPADGAHERDRKPVAAARRPCVRQRQPQWYQNRGEKDVRAAFAPARRPGHAERSVGLVLLIVGVILQISTYIVGNIISIVNAMLRWPRCGRMFQWR